MKRILALGGLIAVAAVTSVTPAFALEDELRETSREVRSESGRRVESATRESDDKLARTTETVESNSDDLMERKQSLEDRKTELRERLEKKALDRKSKLEGRRLAQCQNRQDQINGLITKGTEKSQRHFANIEAFEARITTFADKKSINSEAYAAALIDVQEKKATATSAIEVMGSVPFDCVKVDGDKPADGVKTIREAKQNALRDYRDSVIQLLQAVKAEFAATQSEQPKTEEQ